MYSDIATLRVRVHQIRSESAAEYAAHASIQSVIYKSEPPKLSGLSTQANFIVQEYVTLPFPYAALPVNKLFHQQQHTELNIGNIAVIFIIMHT